MKFTLKLLTNLIIASLFVLTSCSKEGGIGPMGPQGEQGAQGPAGPEGQAGQDGEAQETTGSSESEAGGIVEGEQGQQGDTGPKGDQGDQGPQGESGDNGEDGNANIIDSGWIPAEFSSGRMRVENSGLTADVVNNSLIIVFGVWSDGEEYIFQFPHEIGDEKFSFYLINEGPGAPFVINFLAQSVDGSPITEVFRCDAVKYFILPSNALTGKNSSNDIKKMSYEEVVEQFGLEF